MFDWLTWNSLQEGQFIYWRKSVVAVGLRVSSNDVKICEIVLLLQRFLLLFCARIGFLSLRIWSLGRIGACWRERGRGGAYQSTLVWGEMRVGRAVGGGGLSGCLPCLRARKIFAWKSWRGLLLLRGLAARHLLLMDLTLCLCFQMRTQPDSLFSIQTSTSSPLPLFAFCWPSTCVGTRRIPLPLTAAILFLF
jgi:hypothetical protein